MSRFNAALFKNDKKQSANQPDFSGPGNISKEDFMAIADAITSGRFKADEKGHIVMKIAAWKKQSAGGKSYLSVSLSVDDYGLPVQTTATTVPAATEEDDIF